MMKLAATGLVLAFAGLTPAWAASQPPTGPATPQAVAAIPGKPVAAPAKPISVYVVPIHGEIDTPQMYILRRALKEAIANNVDAVVLDMDTLGGAMSVTLDMMDALAKFRGRTFTYVNDKAISAGSYIADATNEIYFSSKGGRIGAAAVVTGEGADVDTTMKLKINSFIDATVRSMTTAKRYRADVQRAMMDADYVLKIDGKVLKPAGRLLTLTGNEACQAYGRPPESLLGAGIAADIPTMLAQIYGNNGYTIKDFQLTWSEYFAKWLNAISPILLGAGILLLLIEFKTPGFALPGIAGICLLLLVLASHYVAGLAGYEPIALFVVGVILILVELLIFPGSVLCGALGAVCFLSAFVWAMTDVWPGEHLGGVSAEALAQPLINLVMGLALAAAGFAVALRYLPKTWFYRGLVNVAAVPQENLASSGGAASATGAMTLPEPGSRGLAMTDLRPLGEIEIAGGRYQARAIDEQINRGDTVEVVSRKDFALAVKLAENA